MVIAGIDEAGYGPLLGPLCVGLSVLRVRDLPKDSAAPDLWSLLDTAISREPGRGGKPDSKGRIAVADSKKLKLSNTVTTTDPIIHLERGVLAFLRALHGAPPESDTALFSLLGADLGASPWYAQADRALPVAQHKGELALASARLESALARTNVDVLHMACDITDERAFNDAANVGGKAETTRRALLRHLRTVWTRWPGEEIDGGDRLGIVCDRLGGRTQYAGLIADALATPDAPVSVEIIEESDRRSRYVARSVGADGLTRRAGIAFLTEGEDAHLPVALSSMIAKLTRELAMRRFNDYWGKLARDINLELKPTAGYTQDGRRWLADAAPLLTAQLRSAMIRIA